MINRRSLITGLIGLGVTAPAIIRSASLMPVKVMEPTPYLGDLRLIQFKASHPVGTVRLNHLDCGFVVRRGGDLDIPIVAGDLKPGQLAVVAWNGSSWVVLPDGGSGSS